MTNFYESDHTILNMKIKHTFHNKSNEIKYIFHEIRYSTKIQGLPNQVIIQM